ncbi:hypothetical protein PInf_008973 [Phytophthora infestans]|nr:hypothetical protein PInf_008973 [Phytophthora infestans]
MPLTNRRRIMFLSPEHEERLDVAGRDASWAQDRAGTNAPFMKWTFHVIEAKEPNAFCLPGGKCLYLGIVQVDLPFSRKLELEADSIGLRLMAQACYDPRASIQMNTSLVLFDPPTSAERVQALREQLNIALEIYEASSSAYCTQPGPELCFFINRVSKAGSKAEERQF